MLCCFHIVSVQLYDALEINWMLNVQPYKSMKVIKSKKVKVLKSPKGETSDPEAKLSANICTLK